MSKTISPISRRSFLGATLGATAAGLAGAGRVLAQPIPIAHLGVQLYTVRSMMKPDQEEKTIRAIAAIGYKEIEGFSFPDFMRIAPLAKSLGLNPASCHLPTDALLGSSSYTGPSLEKMFADLKGIGTEYAVVPYIMPGMRKPEILDTFGEKLNRAGELAHKAGLQLCYHNHAFEWGQMGGKRTFDRMFASTDPKLVQFEVDVFWLTVGGIDPVHFLEEHAGRVPLLHLKDEAKGQAVQYNENVPKETFKEIGSGTVDFPSIFRVAKKIGVKHYFVEQDQTPGDPIASLRTSYEYIKGMHA